MVDCHVLSAFPSPLFMLFVVAVLSARWTVGWEETMLYFAIPPKTHPLAHTNKERREENTPFTRTFSFGLDGTKPLLVMMMMMILDPLFLSSPLPSFLVHPISHRIPSHLSILSRKKVPANWFSLPAYRKFRGCFLIHDREGTREGQDKDTTARKGLIFEQITTCTPHKGKGEKGGREERKGYHLCKKKFNGYGMEGTWWK
ncbi:hypothetical protein K457DRAFT_608031 [Linnemannia elongata AG-77]|uniref:Uncharacterized protein n=1 Tax=Linnemannia elongata AG-77 TaxID=1314771 RepID=A0A197JU07_9FUNG|nr:hypothetical protein K457DRAFT_608031 [Linnemannia elongata AG-77]